MQGASRNWKHPKKQPPGGGAGGEPGPADVLIGSPWDLLWAPEQNAREFMVIAFGRRQWPVQTGAPRKPGGHIPAPPSRPLEAVEAGQGCLPACWVSGGHLKAPAYYLLLNLTVAGLVRVSSAPSVWFSSVIFPSSNTE